MGAIPPGAGGMGAIPVIDLEGALTPGGPRSAAVAAALREAGMASGFFYVRHHGVPSQLLEGQFALAERFCALPMEARQTIDMRRVPQRRGHEAIGAQQLDAAARLGLKESFYCGIDHADDHPYVVRGLQSYGRNQWPQALPGKAAHCQAYMEERSPVMRRWPEERGVGVQPRRALGPGGEPAAARRHLRVERLR